MDIGLGLVTFAVGLALGSFLNVVILRTRAGRSVIRDRSRCPHCHHPLAWWELVPLASYVLLMGRCAACRKPIHWQYPVVEFLSGAAAVAVVWFHGVTGLGAAGFIGLAGLIIVAWFDGRWGLIPDAFTAVIGAAALVRLVFEPSGWLEQGLGAAAGLGFFGIQHLLSRGRWVGSGDILLGAAIGAWLGWRSLIVALGLAYIVGALVAAGAMLARRLRLSNAMPFGPYLAAGAAVAWFFGQTLIDWYTTYAGF